MPPSLPQRVPPQTTSTQVRTRYQFLFIVERQIWSLKFSGLFLKCGILTLTKMGRSAFPSFTNQVGIPNS